MNLEGLGGVTRSSEAIYRAEDGVSKHECSLEDRNLLQGLWLSMSEVCHLWNYLEVMCCLCVRVYLQLQSHC